MQISKVHITNFKSLADTGDVRLGRINLLVGHNNYGKSAFIQAVHLMQASWNAGPDQIRLGTDYADIKLTLSGLKLKEDIRRHFDVETEGEPPLAIDIRLGRRGVGLTLTGASENRGVGQINAQEPRNFIYTYLSKRKVGGFDQTVSLSNTLAVQSDLRYLVSKVARLANPDYEHAEEYEALCQDVLGFRISVHASPGGQQAGIVTGCCRPIRITTDSTLC